MSRAAKVEVDEELLVARAFLGRVAEPGSLAVAALVEQWGPVEGARLIRADDVPDEVRSATEARRLSSDGRADLDAGVRHGIRLLVPESPDWPHFAFAPLYRAQHVRLATWTSGARAGRYGGEPTVPLGLWVAGTVPLAELGLRSVAVVGARAATAYGEHCAADLGFGLAREDVTVVSGGAFGIDVAAHRGALAADGPTVLVSAGGLDRPYPAAHRTLFDQVRESGLLVSESPPGAAPHRQRFLSRNRIIAALSAGTVVVEAAPRSGALNTAAHCRLLGRPLMAVPGPITSAMSAGCHALLRQECEPARWVTSVADVMEVVGRIGEGVDAVDGGPVAEAADTGPGAAGPTASGPTASGPAAAARLRRRIYDALDPGARRVLDGLPARGWVTEDGLAIRSGIALPEVLRAIPVLRMSGLLQSGPAGHRLAGPARPRPG